MLADTMLTWLQSYLDGRTQFVKIGQHQSTMTVGVPRASTVRRLLQSGSQRHHRPRHTVPSVGLRG